MKLFALTLWTLLCVVAALMFVTAIFIHQSVITALLAVVTILACNEWYDREIKSLID